jgi:putative flippase GtrA
MAIGRFLGVGLACALLHNVIMIGGDFAGWHYVVSSIVSLAIVTVFGYLLHTRWTFPGAARGGEPFRRYALIVSANYPLSLAGMFVLVDLAGVPVAAAVPAVTVALFLFNYAANRWALRVKRSRA